MLPSMEVQVRVREREIGQMRANKGKLDALCDSIRERQRALAPQRRKLDQARALTLTRALTRALTPALTPTRTLALTLTLIDQARAAATKASAAARAAEQAAAEAVAAELETEQAEQLASHELEREQHAIGQAAR